MVTKRDQPIMTLLIAFFVVLAFIVLFVHVCASEAKGQSLPMNPVHIDGSVNPTAIYLDLFDTYYQLQRLSAESDTVYLTIDTLAAQKDTLHNRIDSMQTSRDTIFYAYDAAGGFSVSTTSGDTVDIDTEVREDALFVHGADKAAVACNSAGWYNVEYSVGLKNPTGVALGAVYSNLIKYSSGWSVVAGSYSYGTLAASAAAHENLNGSIAIELVSGDSLAVYVFNGNISDAIVTVAGTVRLRIAKLH